MLHPFNRPTRVASVLAIAAGLSLGAAGIAVAATGSSGSAAHHRQVTPNPVTPPGQDAAGQGQGNTDYTPPGEQVETPDPGDAKGNEAESASDPEPNHQDPKGANVDHTPAGEKPESTGTTDKG